MPSSGDGVYYFSTYVLVQSGEIGRFDMYLNNDIICTAHADHDQLVLITLQDHAVLLSMLLKVTNLTLL